MRKSNGRKSGSLFVVTFGFFMFESGLVEGSNIPNPKSDSLGFGDHPGPMVNGLTLKDLEGMPLSFNVPIEIITFVLFPPYMIPEEKGLVPRLVFSARPPIFWQRAKIAVLSVTLNLGFFTKVYYKPTWWELFMKAPYPAQYVDLFPPPLHSPYQIPSITPYRPPDEFVDEESKRVFLPTDLLQFKSWRPISWIKDNGQLNPPAPKRLLPIFPPSPKLPPICPHTKRGTAPIMDPTQEGAAFGQRFLNACPQESR